MYIVININTNKIRKPDSIFVESGFLFTIHLIFIAVYLGAFTAQRVFLNQSYILSMKTTPNYIITKKFKCQYLLEVNVKKQNLYKFLTLPNNCLLVISL